jgi:hypothetical protein
MLYAAAHPWTHSSDEPDLFSRARHILISSRLPAKSFFFFYSSVCTYIAYSLLLATTQQLGEAADLQHRLIIIDDVSR